MHNVSDLPFPAACLCTGMRPPSRYLSDLPLSGWFQTRRTADSPAFDAYSALEGLGEVPFDQRVQDRVIGVLGRSEPRKSARRGSLLNSSRNLPPELEGSVRAVGHFMSHCIGGGFDVNLFSQARELNRGISEQGKLYRQMERHCYDNPGTFCFCRPVYADPTCVPTWLEFGLVRSDGTLWVEVFEN